MSKNYAKVKQYYEMGLWNKSMVLNAVGRWITADEYKTITGDDYTV
jgi:hypothetical protein